MLPFFCQTLSWPQPDSATGLSKAQELLRNGQNPQAEDALRAFLQSHADSADAHYLLGRVLFLNGKARQSLEEFTTAARYRQPGAADLKIVALNYVVLADYASADRWLTKLLSWTPDDAQAWYYLGRTKFNESLLDEAVVGFQRCLALQPKNSRAQDNLGLSYAGLGRTKEAEAAYKKAIRWQEDAGKPEAGPYLNYGTLLVDTDRIPEAVPLLNRASTLAPTDGRVLRELGKAYLHLAELVKAQENLEKAARLAPDDPPNHFLLAQVYRRQGMADKERDELRLFTALNSKARAVPTHGVPDN